MSNLGKTIRHEFAHSIAGVEGRMFNCIGGAAAGTFSNQTWKASREYKEKGRRYYMTVELRWDDGCRNGQNSFSMCADIRQADAGAWRESSGGQCVDEMKEHFPELEFLRRWHLCDTRGPMHYIANTLYHAGDRDHNGLRKGEARQLRNGKTGQLCWELEEASAPRYVDADTLPEAPPPRRYVPWMRVGEGKDRQLDFARDTAVWPEATDRELCAEPEQLRAVLEARLPALLAAMRADIEGAGFLWECAT